MGLGWLLAGGAVWAGPNDIVVFSAFDYETTHNRRVVAEIGERLGSARILGVPVERYRVGGKVVHVTETGISMVNAAMMTQAVIDRLRPSAIVFAGIAGGINPDFGPGDVLVPQRWFHHSEAAYLNPDPKRPGKYIVPHPADFRVRYPNFGMMFPNNVGVIREGQKRRQEKAFFEVDSGLLRLAGQVVKGVEFDPILERPVKIKVGGRGVAGPVFVDNAEYRNFVFRTWKADVLDMESTAIGQVCWVNRTPFLIIRGISDLAGGQKGQNEEVLYGPAAARHAAQWMGALIAAMGKGTR